MADVYVSVPREVDADELAQKVYDELALAFEGWTPAAGNLETVLTEAHALIMAELMMLATDVDAAIFRYLGIQLVGIAPVDATTASASTTWTLTDDDGHTIPAGTVVAIRGDAGELFGFETIDEVSVPAGETGAEDVLIGALEPGAAGSGLTGQVDIVDQLAFVETVVLDDQTTGGVDAESDVDYLNRLSRELELLAPRPILPDDFAVMARRVGGVGRTTAIDGYNPIDDTEDNERMVTVAVVGEDGEPVSAGVKSDVDDLLQGHREVNFVVHVIDPDYTEIDVAFTAVAYPGYVPAAVEIAAEAAITSYLSPATWGRSPFGDERGWINETKVRYLELAEVLNRVDGLHYVETLTLIEAGGTPGTADVDIDGAAPLTRAGDVSGTVSAP